MGGGGGQPASFIAHEREGKRQSVGEGRLRKRSTLDAIFEEEGSRKGVWRRNIRVAFGAPFLSPYNEKMAVSREVLHRIIGAGWAEAYSVSQD